MSLPFSDLTTFKGLVQTYEKEIGANQGDISGNPAKLKAFTADVNTAWDDYMNLALKASGKWQFDDSNHPDYPIIKTTLVSGQRSYTFVDDELGNIILDIFKVAILPSSTATLYQEIDPIDQQTEGEAEDIVAESTAGGVPCAYDKTANAIFLDPIPNYTVANGLKIHINREASYFVSTDTTKMPGCPGIHHKYFALKPALDYARRNTLATLPRLEREVLKLEGDETQGIVGSIERYFGRRSRDEKSIIQHKKINFV